jgi:hypothetical protein
MNMNELLPGADRYGRMSDEELLRRRDLALGAIADITANLDDGTNMPESSRQELLESREQFHGDLSRHWLQLTERGIS